MEPGKQVNDSTKDGYGVSIGNHPLDTNFFLKSEGTKLMGFFECCPVRGKIKMVFKIQIYIFIVDRTNE